MSRKPDQKYHGVKSVHGVLARCQAGKFYKAQSEHIKRDVKALQGRCIHNTSYHIVSYHRP